MPLSWTTKLVKEEVIREIRKYLDTNENKNTTYQNIWQLAKAVLRGKFIVRNTYIKKQRKISNQQPNFPLKELEKEEQAKPKVSRRKEIMISAEINEIKNRKKSTKLRVFKR